MALHNVVLKIEEKNISLVVLDESTHIGHDQWVDENNLLEEFFPRLQSLLESNSLSLGDVERYTLETDIPTGYTMARIAQTLVSTLNFALET